MSRCRQERFLAAYLDQELCSSARARVEEHLAECADCRRNLAEQEEMRDWLVSCHTPAHSPAYWQAFEARLRERRRGRQPGRVGSWPVAWRAAVALVMLFVLSFGVATGSVSPSKAEILSNIPGATVYLDGEVVGITPLRLSLAPGSHRVALHKEGFRVWEEMVMALSSAPLRLEVKLVSKSGEANAQRTGLQQFALLSVSPNSETIAFLGSKEDFRAGTGELWLYHPAGGYRAAAGYNAAAGDNVTRGQVEKVREGLAIVRPAWSPDGKRLAYVISGANGDSLAIWDRDRNVTRTASPEQALAQIAWLNRDQLLTLGGSDSRLTLHEAMSDQQLSSLEHDSLRVENLRQHDLSSFPVERFALSPDGNWLAYLAATDGRIYLLSLQTSVNRALSQVGRECFALAWSPSGQELAAASRDGLFLYDLTSEKETLLCPQLATELLWTPDGPLLFLQGEGENALWRWNPREGEPREIYRDGGNLNSLALSQGGAILLYSSDATGFRRLWQADFSGQELAVSPLLSAGKLALSSQPQAAEVYLDDEYLCRTPTTLTLSEGGTVSLTLKKETYQDWRLRFSLAEGETRELTARLLPVKSEYQPLSETEGEKREASFSPNGKWLAYSEEFLGNSRLQWMDLEVIARGSMLTSGSVSRDLGPGAHPAWSEDSQLLYFDRGGANSNIWVAGEGGGEATQLTISGAAGNPLPSPQGGWVAYRQALDPAHPELWLMNADGGDARLLVQEEAGQIYAHRWSPDGSEILILVHLGNLDEARLVNLEGAQRTLISGRDLSLAVWSPDGRFLTLQVGAEGRSELQIFRYPELQFYASQSIGQESASLFWVEDGLTWFQGKANGFQGFHLDLTQGVPQVGKFISDCRFLDFNPPTDLSLFAADWNGINQLYQTEAAFP
ncbi:MAG: PEGA domain-containing protein [Coprothermobacterota bacterium]|nr:PEGA domain-containing protein [Coprothermobacterota bacterium]